MCKNNEDQASIKYPIIYPEKSSSIVARFLYNPASGSVIRSVRLRGENGHLWIYGICFIQFIYFANDSIKGNCTDLKEGNIVLLAFPKQVYSCIYHALAKLSRKPQGFDEAFCHSKYGLIVRIDVSSKGRIRCSVKLRTDTVIKTNMNDEDFLIQLDDLDSLNDQMFIGSK